VASRFWLYLGIFLTCSGIATPAGIVMLVIYFWDDLRQKLRFSQYNENTFNINNLNVGSNSNESSGYGYSDPMDEYSQNTKEDMK
jgi:hypothetical protein